MAKLVTSTPDVLFQELSGEAVLLNLSTERYYGLDEVGTHMYQLLVEHGQIEIVANMMLSEYDTDEQMIRRDLARLISQLVERGLLAVSD